MSKGVTLLEMLVVLAVTAMAVGVTAPAVVSMLESRREAAALTVIRDHIARLPWIARETGKPLAYGEPGETGEQLPVPDDWTIDWTRPLRVNRRGMCSDASAVLQTPRRTVEMVIAGPYCEAVDDAP